MHVDIDKIWRLMSRWEKGFSWSLSELSEFNTLYTDWVRYYMSFGNIKEAHKLCRKREMILNNSETVKCRFRKKRTYLYAKCAEKKPDELPETFI